MATHRFSCGPLDVPTGSLWPPAIWKTLDVEIFGLMDGSDQPTYDPVTGAERRYHSAVCRNCGWRMSPEGGQANELNDAFNRGLAHIVERHRDLRESLKLEVQTTRTGLATSLGAELVDEDPAGLGRDTWVVAVG